jgi:hypothetical protein
MNQPLGLRALACSRRPEKDQSHEVSPPGSMRDWPRTLRFKISNSANYNQRRARMAKAKCT